MDTLEDKQLHITRAGSFYASILADESIQKAKRLSKLSSQTLLSTQGNTCVDNALHKPYTYGFCKTFRFNDADVLQFGINPSLQQRSNGEYEEIKAYNRYETITIADSFFAIEEFEHILSETTLPILFPGATDVEVAASTCLLFGLKLPNDVQIDTIQTSDRLLMRGVDFVSKFGCIVFKQNPIDLFPSMKFTAQSYTQRSLNILSYTLSSDVYGPVDRIMNYYKKTQSKKAFYLAAVQAAGLAVISQDCVIVNSEPLLDGYTYFTNNNTYSAPYRHTRIKNGTKLSESYVIGGVELIDYIDYTQPITYDVDISMDDILPVRGLRLVNETRQIKLGGAFRPVFDGDATSLQAYWDYIYAYEQAHPTGSEIVTGNLVTEILRGVLNDRAIVLRINESMPEDMRLKLDIFTSREQPAGSVLLYSLMNIIIPL